jgi:hypothetical protein
MTHGLGWDGPVRGVKMVVNDVKDLNQADSQILHPGTRALYRYWETIRAENAAPARQALDLRAVKSLIPNLALLERDNLRKSYKWRLAGVAVGDLHKESLTGSDALSRWDTFERSTVQKLYGNVVTDLQPCLIRFRLIPDQGEPFGVEQIGLPLLASGGQIQIFGGMFPFENMRDRHHESITGIELFGARMIWTEHLPGDQLVAKLRRTRDRAANLSVIRGGKEG